MNRDTPAVNMPVDFVAEAEKIICNHMRTGKRAAAPAVYTSHMPKTYTQPTSNALATHTGKKKTISAFDVVLNIVMVLACVAIVAVFAFGMMS
ncbi:MAG: hypothetical protein FWF78_01940 [Defluviitaleaceae bacterium]|nr:hypothetical protein [Defluviitaleaceae bacterium]